MVPPSPIHEPATKHRLSVVLAFVGSLALPFVTGCDAGDLPEPRTGESPPQAGAPAEEGSVEAMEAYSQYSAAGTFQVTVTPRDDEETPEGMALGHSILTKELHGDLEGSAEGAMLTALTPEEGSAGYVAIELVRGTLNGRSGTFLLQHHGLMDRGAQDLSITVIPGSGTGELEGIRGTMSLDLTGAERGYELRYTLPDGE
jgi:hypothetical protein